MNKNEQKFEIRTKFDFLWKMNKMNKMNKIWNEQNEPNDQNEQNEQNERKWTKMNKIIQIDTKMDKNGQLDPPKKEITNKQTNK